MKSVGAERYREEIIRERQRPIGRTAYILGPRSNESFRKIKAGKSLIDAYNRLAMGTPGGRVARSYLSISFTKSLL